jgi:hypothetical protein
MVAVLAVVSCGGGGGGEPPVTTGGTGAVFCSALFSSSSSSNLAATGLSPAVTEEKVVDLSTCAKVDGNVTIGKGACGDGAVVGVDKSFTGDQGFSTITVKEGTLAFPLNETRELDAAQIVVDDKGLFSAGTDVCAVTGTVTVKFTGERPCKEGDCTDNGKKFFKGIDVLEGGSLELTGAKGVPSNGGGVSWTHLSMPAGPPGKYGDCKPAEKPCVGNVNVKVAADGATTLHLADDVTAGQRPWAQGDWIAVATTSFNPLETEFVQLAGAPSKADGGGSMVMLMQPLKFYHFGLTAPSQGTSNSKCKDPQGVLLPASFCDKEDKNWGVDERAEVGLISRNVKLTADTPSPYDSTGKLLSPQPAGLHWGGEIKIWPGSAKVVIRGVEIEKFGKDQLSSYPVHFHMNLDVKNKPVVDANSIHHSYNKCITIHSTSNLTVQNNVCARIVGHIYYEEMGDEAGIVFKHNLGLGAMSNNFGIASRTRTVEDVIRDDWWPGDYLTNDPANKMTFNSYDGLQIPNTDNQKDPTRGSCGKVNPGNGLLVVGAGAYTDGHVVSNDTKTEVQVLGGACNQDELYFEPASGFWIANPTTQLTDNSIGGCQGVGRGFWYVPPGDQDVVIKKVLVKGVVTKDERIPLPAELKSLSLQPVGMFKDDRVHSCYSGLYAEGEFGVQSQSLFPYVGATKAQDPDKPRRCPEDC